MVYKHGRAELQCSVIHVSVRERPEAEDGSLGAST